MAIGRVNDTGLWAKVVAKGYGQSDTGLWAE